MKQAELDPVSKALLALTQGPGVHATRVAEVKILRLERSAGRVPMMYEPSIVILISGKKLLYAGEREFQYDAANYLIVSVPMSFEVKAIPTSNHPVLGLSVRIDLSLLTELSAKMQTRYARESPEHSAEPVPLSLEMADAAKRLVLHLHSEEQAAVLAPGVVREITYHALRGQHGSMLWSLLNANSKARQIYEVLGRMHQNYAEPFNAERVASEVAMSVSAFHRAFKSVTEISPLQYLKNLRLHRARLMILHERVGIREASVRVGYTSASQFSREFKRLFGRGPMEELRLITTPQDYVALGSAMTV